MNERHSIMKFRNTGVKERFKNLEREEKKITYKALGVGMVLQC